MKLLRHPKPYPDESFLGYIVRLGYANGYESVTSILSVITSKSEKWKSYTSFVVMENSYVEFLNGAIGHSKFNLHELTLYTYGSTVDRRFKLGQMDLSIDFINY